MGPFLDSTDGNTPETILTIAQADIRLTKNGGTYAQTNNVAGATHMEYGKYGVPLNTTDTGTLGSLRADIHVAGALAVWEEFMIVPAHIYDVLVLGTDKLEVDLVQMNNDAQSLIDLKDFADAGYDPVSNKIQGVVLADTVTTLTGHTAQTGDSFARLGSPAAASIAADLLAIDNFVDEIESRLTAARAGYLDNLSAGAVALEATLTAIKGATYAEATDSLEALRNRGDTAWLSATGFSTHNAAAIWSAGSRTLSTPADYKADISSLALEATLTARTLLAAGYFDPTTDTVANVTAVATATALGAQAKSDVNTEADSALADIHLDHLLALNYDPASKPGVATALLNELIENDGGISRYTANALEQAPSGGTNPNVLVSTTIATVTDQTHFTLTAGSNDNDAYKDQSIVIYDASDSDFPSVRKCSAYTGATRTVTIDAAPDFTIVLGDGAKAFVTAPGTTAPTADQNADAVWDEAISGHVVGDTFGAKNQKAVPSETTNDYKATGFSTHSAADIWSAAGRALSTPNDYKADVSALALASVCTDVRLAHLDADITSRSSHVAADIWAVGTRALSATGIIAIWDKDISAYVGAGYAGTYVKMLRDDWLNGGRLDLILDAVNTETGTHPTLAEMEASTVLALKSQLITQGTNDFNATAKAAIESECSDALTTYDSPTRTEATTDKDAIITEVNANETKIDTVDGIVDAIKAKTDNLPSGLQKNVALSNFSFLMTDSTTNEPKAGLTVTVQISKDGGAFSNATNTPATEISNGAYKINLTQAERTADVSILKATASGANQTTLVLVSTI